MRRLSGPCCLPSRPLLSGILGHLGNILNLGEGFGGGGGGDGLGEREGVLDGTLNMAIFDIIWVCAHGAVGNPLSKHRVNSMLRDKQRNVIPTMFKGQTYRFRQVDKANMSRHTMSFATMVP